MTTFESPNDNSGKQATIGLPFFSSGWSLEMSVLSCAEVHTASLPHRLSQETRMEKT